MYFNVVLFTQNHFNSLNSPSEYLLMEAIAHSLRVDSVFGKIQNVGLSYIILSGSVAGWVGAVIKTPTCLQIAFSRDFRGEILKIIEQWSSEHLYQVET